MTNGTCSIDGCAKPAQARGWCPMHYQRWRKHGSPDYHRDPMPRVCTVDGCDTPALARGWCPTHYRRWRLHGSTDTVVVMPRSGLCIVEGCEAPILARRWCRRHYARWSLYGSTDITLHKPISRGCAIDGCEKSVEARDLCSMHYKRQMYQDAKAEGRCVWGNGRGCTEPPVTGMVMCPRHQRIGNERSRSRVDRRHEQSYNARRLLRCWMCGGNFTDDDPRQNDHLIPNSLGGPDELWNYAPAHRSCNIQRSNLSLAETVAKHHPNGIADQAVAVAIGEALERQAAYAA